MSMRTFIAIELSDQIRENLGRLESALKGHLGEAGVDERWVRWSGLDKAHLTLRFLDETSGPQRAQIRAGLAEVVTQHAPFILTLADLGCFPGWAQPQVVWTGVTGDLTALHALRTQTEELAQAAGFAADDRPFAPHITLARTARRASAPQQRQIGAALAAFRATPPLDLTNLGTLRVEEIVFMRSELLPTRSVHTPLDRFEILE